jgi:hypothetical protein
MARHDSMQRSDHPVLDQLSDKEFARLKQGATVMRSLVRVKVADDADLLAAREALATISQFFSLLRARAFRRDQGLYDTIVQLS